jgi:threonine/homoserine/homoserine lactone efflux protein
VKTQAGVEGGGVGNGKKFWGDLSSMLMSFASVGALLSTAPIIFNILKIICAFYLLYLGIQMWIESGSLNGTTRKKPVKGQSTLLLIQFLQIKLFYF